MLFPMQGTSSGYGSLYDQDCPHYRCMKRSNSMLLCLCRTCGQWKDITLALALQNMFATLAQSVSPDETGVLCPDGHGAMVPVQATDRIALFEPEFEIRDYTVIDRREIERVLKRLKTYYGDCARIVGKQARECVDQQSMCDKAVLASRWDARHDAVCKVAENLGIVQREEDINKIMTVFPAYTYKSYPTPKQVDQLVDRADAMGLTADDLYHIFSSGIIPHKLDALMKDLSVHWRPSGHIVDTDAGVRWLQEGHG
jgi:hypothetical protein